MSAHRALSDFIKAFCTGGPGRLADPGDDGTITVVMWAQICSVTTTEASEKRTLAQPTAPGVLCTVSHDTDGGDFDLTVTGSYNRDNDTDINFADAKDFVVFYSVKAGSSYSWRILAQEGTDASVEEGTFDTLTAAELAVSTSINVNLGAFTVDYNGYVSCDAIETNNLNVANNAVVNSIESGDAEIQGSLTVTSNPTVLGGLLATYQDVTPATAADGTAMTADMTVGSILVATPTSAKEYQLLNGTETDAALAAVGITPASGLAFDLTIINLGGTGDTITLTVDTNVTIVGDPIVGAVADIATTQAPQGTFRFVRGATGVYVAYRVA